MKYLILFALFAFACAQEWPEYDRPCSERSAIIRPQVKTAFNVAAYSGTWFEIGRYQQQDEPLADCMSSSYSWGFITNSFTIGRVGTVLENDTPWSRSATALLAFPDVERDDRLGLLNVTYYADREADQTNYYVLGTDYFQYAVGWGCEDLDDNRSREFAWLLSRTPELPEAYQERVDFYVDQFVDRALLRNTEQSLEACFSSAAHQEFRLKNAVKISIVLCEENLKLYKMWKQFLIGFLVIHIKAQHISDKPCPERPIQQNFDIEKYTSGGSWYDILHYEARFSKGCNCGLANYTLNEDKTVEVLNCCKYLANTTLHCTNGAAKASEPDHVPLEGKLNVAFFNRPANVSNYWVLSTDYDNYSIVYYCKNIDDNKSRELAWLLSRKPLLDQLDETVKTTALGLIETHFDRSKMYESDQSAERLIFSVIEVNCQAAITYQQKTYQLETYQSGSCAGIFYGMSNFDMNRFLGEWVEYFRFVYPDTGGDCVRNYYSLNAGTTYNLTETKKYLETGTNVTEEFIVQLADPSSNRGKLLVTNKFNYLYVEATDYDRIAVIQVCEEITASTYNTYLWILARPGYPLTRDDITITGNVGVRDTIQDSRCGSSAVVPSVLALLVAFVVQKYFHFIF
ncbi:CLUMA_CG012145, isoform A [Clunio marinus]|uniref:Apolipoprotein D n=1 Tax=Clunio marinus TaxID=568069 RepID=A0A1J1II58_9DIPT|nr:CLUMA_CG012145, isoform A [Clunio marinus]